MKIFILLLILVLIIIAIALIIFQKNKYQVKTVEVDCIKMEDLIAFFKEPSRLDALKKNENFITVAVKEKVGDDTFKIFCTVFDKEKNTVVDLENCTIAYKSKKLDDPLAEAFGDKNMIILS